MRRTVSRALTFVWIAAAVVANPPPGKPQTVPDGLLLDLAGALQRARAYSQQFMQATTAAASSREDRAQAKAALLPAVTLLNQFVYTQPNGTPSGVFVANDGVHIYNEQMTLHADLLSFTRMADYRRALAAEAAAQARKDVALRGLAAVVVQNYYALVGARRHEDNAQRSADEALRFLELTRKQERGGEVARTDVIKAQIQYQQRQRDLQDATTASQKAQVELAVMVFPDPGQAFRTDDDLRPDTALPAFDEVQPAAVASSPDIRASEFEVKQANAGISSARAGYYPTFALDYFYGFNANVFAFHGPDGRNNLGSVVQATATVPVWNWGTTRSKVRQAELQRHQAQFDLISNRRALQAALRSSYLEAQTAQSQIDSLKGSSDLSEESLRLTLLRYEAGEASALEVVDAQNTLMLARNAYDDGLTRYRMALAALQILTGKF